MQSRHLASLLSVAGRRPIHASIRASLFAAVLASLLAFLAAAASGCGDDSPPPMPAAVLGTYDVDVTANGKTDHTIMTVSQGSNLNVLLNFTMGISTVRCQMIGSTQLTLPRQTLHVAHASGVADGQATGGGTISAAGAVDLTINLTTAGFGGDAGASGGVEYKFTGARQ